MEGLECAAQSPEEKPFQKGEAYNRGDEDTESWMEIFSMWVRVGYF